jgi:phenylpropionate dioxygenase-like ring-hydroxylating dioxygenase large terminal subunit
MEGWIAVTRTTTLGQQPRRVSLRNKNYVVWRDKNFTPRIQSDVCRHRGASLSTGRVRDGCVECPYHGWKYTETSVTQPWSNISENFMNEFNTWEKDGLLWVRPVGHVGPEPPEVPHATDPGFNTAWFETTIKQSAQLIIENGIDPCHASWVHANPLGFGSDSERPTNVIHFGNMIAFDYVPNKEGISTKLFGLDTTKNLHKFILPYTTWSDVIIHGGKILTTYVTLCPVSDTETKMFVGFSQNFGVPSELFILMGKAIVEQDRVILENLDPSFRYKGTPGAHDDLVELYRKSLHELVFR